jgi:hypothetical protein
VPNVLPKGMPTGNVSEVFLASKSEIASILKGLAVDVVPNVLPKAMPTDNVPEIVPSIMSSLESKISYLYFKNPVHIHNMAFFANNHSHISNMQDIALNTLHIKENITLNIPDVKVSSYFREHIVRDGINNFYSHYICFTLEH